MYPLKQSTALTVVFFAHDINGDAVNSLTDGSWTKRQSKNGGAFAAMTVTVTYMENGWYSLPLSTAHTDTLGINTIVLTNAGCKQVNLQYRVHARLQDDLAFPATSGRSMVVDAAGLVDSNVVKLGPTGAGTAQTARDVGGQLDAAITSRMATYTQPTGFLAATFPAAIASTTNITAGVITTVTNLTNAPTVGDLTATMKTSVTTAATAATPVAASVSGNVVGSVGSVAGNVVGSVGSVAGNVVGRVLGTGATAFVGVGVRAYDDAGNAIAPASTALSSAVWTGTKAGYLDAAITSRMATYTQPTGFLAATFSGTVASVGSAMTLATDALNATALAASAVTEIVDAIWVNATRTLTASPVDAQDISDISDAVWAETIRTLTSVPTDPLLTKISKVTSNNVTRVGDIITIYEDDEVTVFRTYDLANGGRIIQS